MGVFRPKRIVAAAHHGPDGNGHNKGTDFNLSPDEEGRVPGDGGPPFCSCRPRRALSGKKLTREGMRGGVALPPRVAEDQMRSVQ